MPSFGRTSRDRLEDADPRLRAILEEAIKVADFTVLETHRSKQKQNRLYEQGRSQLKYPRSKHNKYPSLAVDIAPWPVDWDDVRRFDRLSGLIFGIAHSMGYDIRWGGDWNRDWNLADNRFNDLPHFELVG